MKRTYISKKLRSLIVANTFQIVVDYSVVLCSNIIAGNMLGETALSAISLASPFLTLIFFFSDLSALGTSALISYQVGRQNREKADCYFGQGLISTLCTGAIISLAYLLLNTLNPNLFSVSAEMNAYFQEYFQYVYILPLIQVPGSYLYIVVLNEGGEKACIASSVIRAVSMIGLSIALCGVMGVGGVGLAGVISYLVARLPVFAFMFSRRFSLRPRRYFNWKMLGRIARIGVSGAGVNLFQCLMRLILNVFLLQAFGEPSIVIFTVMMSVLELMIALFSSIGMSLSMPVSLYRGEKMQKGLIKTMSSATRTALIEGAVLTLLLLLFSGRLASWFGVADAMQAAQVADGAKIFAVSAVPTALLLLFISYYSYMEKTKLAFGITTLYMMVLPVALGIALGLALGLNGVWWGISLSGVIALAALALAVKRRQKGRTFPLLLDSKALDNELSYDVEKSGEGVMQLVDMVERDLLERNFTRAQINRIMLMIEETQMLALKVGNVKNELIECGLVLEGEVSVILRDSGSSLDPADEETVKATGDDYLGMMLIGSHDDRMFTLAGGKSRVVYRFPGAE